MAFSHASPRVSPAKGTPAHTRTEGQRNVRLPVTDIHHITQPNRAMLPKGVPIPVISITTYNIIDCHLPNRA